MAYSDRDQLELLSRIGTAFLSAFTEEDKARTPEFYQEMKELFGRITADWTEIGEIESSAKPDQLMVAMLRGRIDVRWKEVVAKLLTQLPSGPRAAN